MVDIYIGGFDYLKKKKKKKLDGTIFRNTGYIRLR
jgi:hypothetical protein